MVISFYDFPTQPSEGAIKHNAHMQTKLLRIPLNTICTFDSELKRRRLCISVYVTVIQSFIFMLLGFSYAWKVEPEWINY
jgi:hypothetical protein